MFSRKTKARKNGPLKALQSVMGGDSNNNHAPSRSGTNPKGDKSSSKGRHAHSHPNQSKDDISMAHSQTREKVKANPYATIKMWRPTATKTSSVGMEGEEVYQSFTNFDALRFNSDAEVDAAQGRLPPTGDLRNVATPDLAYSRRPQPAEGGASGTGRGTRRSYSDGQSKSTPHQNGFDEIPTDYSRDNSPAAPLSRKVSFKNDDAPLTNGRAAAESITNKSFSSSSSSSRQIRSSTPPLPSSPPPSLPSSPPPSSARSQHDTSFQVVSDGATNSIKLVLSHKYTDTSSVDLAGQDVERLLAELKYTMDSLRTSRIDKNAGQLAMCLSELHAQTKQFIQEAKLVVSSANNSKEKMVLQLESAIHTLACIFLHGQAAMLMMPSAHDAQHLGFQLIKAANSFKSTVGAASAAVGKALSDPHMKYLMRQATNLASLLGTLLTTIREVQAK